MKDAECSCWDIRRATPSNTVLLLEHLPPCKYLRKMSLRSIHLRHSEKIRSILATSKEINVEVTAIDPQECLQYLLSSSSPLQMSWFLCVQLLCWPIDITIMRRYIYFAPVTSDTATRQQLEYSFHMRTRHRDRTSVVVLTNREQWMFHVTFDVDVVCNLVHSIEWELRH